MKRLHPKANPQYWANSDRLSQVFTEHGEDAMAEEFRRMQEGIVPPVTRDHRIEAAAYRRWNGLPPLSEPFGLHSDSQAATPQTVSK